VRKSVLESSNVSEETIDLIARMTAEIPWPKRRSFMGETAVSLLKGSSRLAESVFGWNRNTVEVGINEFQTGFRCVDDIANRKRKTIEEKHPQLLIDIQKLVDPKSHADYQLRTNLAYTNITAKAVYESLLENGWSEDDLPTVRTISNLLNRHGYRVRSVEKTMVQKKRKKPMQSSRMSER